ncbi:MAG: LON peptidase substrate-binding domain-containing protein [Acidobacteriota bacterium]
MSESTEKVIGVKHLPIFPLPLVLFPNELLPLHIFEPRYRQMLKDVQLGNNLFGISYFDSAETDWDKPEIGSIGCVTEVREVREVQAMDDGRSNILTVGVIRYEIEDYVDSDEPYLVAEVSFFEDFEEDEDLLNPIADNVFNLFKRVASAAQELSGNAGSLPELPQAEPEMLSFLVAAAFNLPNEVKSQLLNIRSTIERLDKMEDILKQAVVQMEESAAINKVAKTNGHSTKKIDLDF